MKGMVPENFLQTILKTNNNNKNSNWDLLYFNSSNKFVSKLSLHNKKTSGSVYSGVSTARAKIQRSHQHVRHPERIVEVPKDGNLSGFSCRDICSVLSCMKFNPSIIARIKNHRINGRTFGKLTDDELRDLGINNPIVQHFRNKSKRKHCIFML